MEGFTNSLPNNNEVELTRDNLERMVSLEMTVEADLNQVLESVKRETGVELTPRPGGYHLTIIGPSEYKALKTLSDDDLKELSRINEEIKRGEGIVTTGIGFLDGSSNEYQFREADKTKKTAFITVEIPKLNFFRERVGLVPRDFHITLGFSGGDIHMHIIGQEPIKPNSTKMKDITALIPKIPNQRFASIQIPKLSFSGLDGQLKSGQG